MSWLLVAVGGALGAAARYLLDRAIAVRQTGPFPLGTLVINVSGNIALGLLLGAGRRPPASGQHRDLGRNRISGRLHDLLDFHLETLRLLEDGAWRYAAWNLLLSGPLSFAGALVAFLAVR